MATEQYKRSTYHGDGAKSKESGLLKETADEFPLTAGNFKWMAVAAAMIVAGFLLMLGSGSTEEFNPDIFSVRRIVIGPGVAFLGFVAMGVAIIRRPKGKKD
ncbi:MAG: DUF3098 domain-containing protein [Muribaculaceae bacterium]|nr:DUF3098 domain-containing protein [Muribaculaceae bacterium]